MGTRCIIEFKDSTESHLVYQHWDGYPSGVQDNVRNALRLAWELPRFEPDEFACAYIAANKTQSGNLRLLRGRNVPSDVEYWHVVRIVEGALTVASYHFDGTKRARTACEVSTI